MVTLAPVLSTFGRPEAWFTEDRVVDSTGRFGIRPRFTRRGAYFSVDNLKGETRVSRKTPAAASRVAG